MGEGSEYSVPELSSFIRSKQQSNIGDDLKERDTQDVLRQLQFNLDKIDRDSKMKKDEEWELAKRKIWEISRRSCDVASSASPLKLKFSNKISQPLRTGDEIKGEGDVFIEIALVDCLTDSVVEIGPEAYAKVELVLLKGDFADNWTNDEFNENIVREEEGKTPFLLGNVNLELQRGVAVLRDVKFKHDTIKMKPPVFKLGARVDVHVRAIGVQIKEATTKSFTLSSYHKKYIEKYDTPALSDKVHRLKNITQRGPTGIGLRDENILTVEDFLIQLLIDPETLKKVFKLGNLKWDATVRNARACRNVNDRKYCYINPEKTTGVVFNALGEVQGLYLGHQDIAMNMLSDDQKVHAKKMLESAYRNWKQTVVFFDDEISLQQHIIKTIVTVSSSSNVHLAFDDMEAFGVVPQFFFPEFIDFSHEYAVVDALVPRRTAGGTTNEL